MRRRIGNSGGPVLEIDHEGLGVAFKIIGVISEYVPFADAAVGRSLAFSIFSNSGYSIATPMDFVLDLVK